ncbi:MAG: hypothetical protein OES57_06170 [Acidimicrobiia bacterium]|nr:hypothetical protein [Acidimicrobiia bacterium]
MSGTESLRRFTDRVVELAAELAGPEFPSGDQADAEQLEHLIDQVVAWLGWEVFHADPARPAFHRHNDLLTQWGGPNADNVYRHARVEPGRRYRITGHMHSCSQFLLAVRKGFMHNEVWGTVETLSASDLGLGPDDRVDITLGGPPVDGAHVPLPDGAVMVSIREYYDDWLPAEPATFVIECLDDVGPAPAVTEVELAERLDRAFGQVSDSLWYWTRYLNDQRAQRTVNRFGEGIQVAKGLAQARYSFLFWDLAPDEAIVVECDVPDAPYWGFQLYRMGTFELVDPVGRCTSRNHRQTQVSADGRLRLVLAPVDVGAANWLDTAGRPEGLCTLRWFWPRTDASPETDATVVKIDAVAEALPGDTPMVTADQRAAELAARRAHLAWRFRT